MSKSIHASWLAREGGSQKISLIDDCVRDVINAYMQCAKSLGYETRRYMGVGPNMNALLEIVNLRRNSKYDKNFNYNSSSCIIYTII